MMINHIFLLAAPVGILAWYFSNNMGHNQSSTPAEWPPKDNGFPLATFAGGCFWGLELAFQREPGVVGTCVGYTNGNVDNPSYEAVCSGSTGHAEAVQLTYNPDEV